MYVDDSHIMGDNQWEERRTPEPAGGARALSPEEHAPEEHVVAALGGGKKDAPTKAAEVNLLAFTVFSLPCSSCISYRLCPAACLTVNVAAPSHDPATGGAAGGNLSRSAQKRNAEALLNADKNGGVNLSVQSVLANQRVQNLKSSAASENISREITRVTSCIFVRSNVDCVFVSFDRYKRHCVLAGVTLLKGELADLRNAISRPQLFQDMNVDDLEPELFRKSLLVKARAVTKEIDYQMKWLVDPQDVRENRQAPLAGIVECPISLILQCAATII